jgi:monoamine oxidase
MTFKEWSGRPDLIAELTGLLAHPTMQLALSVCTEVGLPRTKFPANTPNLIENHALANAKHEGYFEFPKNLRALATLKPESPDEGKLVPWKYTSENLED